MDDTAVVCHVKFTNHGKQRLMERVCPFMDGGLGEAKRWARAVVEDAVERNGFSRSQPEWVQRRWTQADPEPKGSNVRYLRCAVDEHRFCLVVGYAPSKRKSDPPRWNVITVLPETQIQDKPFPSGENSRSRAL